MDENVQLDSVIDEKDLGLLLITNSSFTERQVNKTNKVLGLSKRLFDSTIKERLVHGFVQITRETTFGVLQRSGLSPNLRVKSTVWRVFNGKQQNWYPR